MRQRPYGPEAWLIDGLDDPAAWAQALREHGHPAVDEIVPAHDTVVVRCSRSAHPAVGELIAQVRPAPPIGAAEDPVVLDVRYAGADLAAVAERVGMDVEEVIDVHASVTYRVAFCGFSPGFAYLTGLDPRLQIPRRASPRTSVPAGSVAIAAEYACVYPSPSPGGWHLLGVTEHVVWDIGRRPPALLRPGRAVRFRPVRG